MVFLSYAHSDSDAKEAKYVEKFFEDLCSEVAIKSGDPVSSCGFLDSYHLRTGDP